MKTNAVMEERHDTRTESCDQDLIQESRMEESMGNIVSSAKSGLGSFTSMVRRIFKITGFVLAVAALTVTVLYLTGVIHPKGAMLGNGMRHRKSAAANVPVVNYDLGPEILDALEVAYAQAESYADGELDGWIAEVMGRVDNGYLDDYFGYLNTRFRELRGIGYWARNKLGLSQETADELLTRELEDMVSKKVICPEISQKRIENITNEAIDIYLSCLDKELQRIQQEHKIPTPAWNEYIADICGMTRDMNTQSHPLSVKIAVSSGLVIAIAASPALFKIAQTISARIAKRAGLKVVEKAGTKIVVKTIAKTGGKTLLKSVPIIGWGITAATLGFDIADHNITSAKNKAMLRENSQTYLDEVKRELLGCTEGSIMGSITDWENNIKGKIAKK